MRMVRRALPISLLVTLFAASSLSSSGASAADVGFASPVRVSANDDQSAAEPSIRAARDGTLYISAPTGLGGARIQEKGRGGDLLWRSDDDGKTWEFLGNYDPAQGGGDSDIAPDREGVLWASGLTLANTTVGISTDRGETFRNNPVGSLETVVDRQWIETYRAEPFAFLTTGQISDRRIILSRIERSAGDYPVVTKTVTVSGEQEEYQWPGEIAVDETGGLVYVTYNTDGEPERNDQIVVTRSDLKLERNKRFTVTTTKGDSFDSFSAIDVDQAGNVYVVWTERRPQGPKAKFGKTNSYLSVSKDKGQSWSTPVKLNTRMRTTTFPWIVAGSKGRVAVAYYGIRQRGPSPENVFHETRKVLPKWKVFVAYSLNADRAGATFRNVRAVPRFIHEGNLCTSGTGCAPGTRDLLDFFQLDLDACGKIVITYTDNSTDVVEKDGTRSTNNQEYVSFVGQDSGPSFYTQPLNPEVC
ncbi:MAG: glycoside hydrolase [Actinomycetota bacterium]|nr:glycoside hydrolase [Actinomycetota bacterium]